MKDIKLDKFIKKELEEKFLYLSVYQPFSEGSRKTFRTRLKSLCLRTFRDSNCFKSDSDKHNLLIDRILLEESKLSEIGEGVGLFMKFDPEKVKPNSKQEEQIEDFHLFKMTREVEPKGFLGKVYDLDQLAWAVNTSIRAFIVSVQEKKLDLYKYFEDEITHLKSFESEYELAEDKENLEKYSPMGAHQQRGVYHGLGEKNVSRKKKSYVVRLLNRAKDFIVENIDVQSVNNIVVFYDEAFTEEIDKFLDKFKSISCLKVLQKKLDLQNENVLRKKTEEKIREQEENMYKDLRVEYKEKYNSYIKSWKQIAEATRQEKVEKIFLNPKIEKKGFLKDGLVYTSKQRDCKKLDNIRPWIVNNILVNNGKVWVNGDLEEKLDTHILVKLRF